MAEPVPVGAFAPVAAGPAAVPAGAIVPLGVAGTGVSLPGCGAFAEPASVFVWTGALCEFPPTLLQAPRLTMAATTAAGNSLLRISVSVFQVR
jgi:hypothetical protein